MGLSARAGAILGEGGTSKASILSHEASALFHKAFVLLHKVLLQAHAASAWSRTFKAWQHERWQRLRSGKLPLFFGNTHQYAQGK